MRLSISALEEQEQPVRRSEEPRKREEHREDRQQKNVLDEVPQYNPFADAFKNQEFSDN